MNRQEIIEYLGSAWTGTMSIMGGTVHSDVTLLDETNSRLFFNSGKMLRPIMSLLVARACSNEPNEDSCKYAAATELLHNATLLHDDVADESSERRGIPTVNALLGPRAAVLVGDFWLAKAVDTIISASIMLPEVIKIFSRTLVDLSEGEMLQLEKAGDASTTEKDYLRIIYCKTASLFVVSCVTGALSVKAPQEYRDAVRSYAEAAGIAFQIKDDILDYVGDVSLGKPVGIDIAERKITLPLFGAMKNAGTEAEIRSLVRSVREHPENCGKIHDFVMANGGIDYAAAVLDRYIEDAVSALSPLPDTKAKTFLGELVRFNSFRKA